MQLTALYQSQGSDGRRTFDLIDEDYPSGKCKENLRDAGLVLTEQPETVNGPLSFNPRWSPTSVDNWLRSTSVDFFAYADARYGLRAGPKSSDYHWALVTRDHSKLILVKKRQAITGEDLVRSKSTGGRSNAIAALHFGESTMITTSTSSR